MMNKTDLMDHSKFHYLEPDYYREIFKLHPEFRKSIHDKFLLLYGEQQTKKFFPELERLLKVYYAYKSEEMIEWEKHFNPENRFTEKDVILITYGDLIQSTSENPLKVFHHICDQYLHGVITTIHILPFFPYSSDRGFAIMDFVDVDPNLGAWEDILDMKTHFRLMFDGVLNHVSSKCHWFQEFLNQNPEFEDFFTVFSTKQKISEDYLKIIVRPRTTELLSAYQTLNGPRMVWTTFSADQIDLNYKNPKVILKMIEILLTYIRRGADIIRLDAVTYLWEELGTSCVHLEQNHITIKLFRDILDAVAPHVALITETNVPHADNIRYFGNGFDEAQMVYNFALPPLVLFTFQNENSAKLTEWAKDLKPFSRQATFFNFLDSHDGVGVMAVRDILTPREIEMMSLKILEHGGYISYKDNGDGTTSPYEFNITWWSAINNDDTDESKSLQVERYLASRAIALVMMGVPGIYLHGFLGSKNDAELVLAEKQTRSINRKNIMESELIKSLGNPKSTTFQVTSRLRRLIKKRINEPAFHPNAGQKVFNISDKLFCLLRTANEHNQQILTVTNISNRSLSVNLNLDAIPHAGNRWQDIVSGSVFTSPDNYLRFDLKPYQVCWLKNKIYE
ncbi:MAG: sugar phosphorylase [Calditrichaceae bacterium]|nr:sugar phosphorylase [Calditrichaceae bacterium]MBN2707630.1 sugar phosphorylase [Calditrichaceae bacterium]